MANRKWIIPLVVIALLLVANVFRYEEGPSFREGLTYVKYEYDKWTGQMWADVYAGGDYKRILIDDLNYLGKDAPRAARGIWFGLIIANLVWLTWIIYPPQSATHKVVYFCAAFIICWFLGAFAGFFWK